jgi:predicted PurR-regulated permease PerM
MIFRGGIDRAIGLAVLTLLALGCFAVLQPFLSAILWAVLLSFSSWRLNRHAVILLEGRRSLAAGLMTLAAGLMTLAVGLVLVLPVVAAVWSLADEALHLAEYFAAWRDRGPPGPPEWIERVPLFGPELKKDWLDLAGDQAAFAATLRSYEGVASQWALNAGTGFGHAVSELFASLFILFFLYRDGTAAAQLSTQLMERLAGTRARQLIEVASGTVRGVVYSLVGGNLVLAVLGALGFWMAGVPWAFFWGAMTFILQVIPFGTMLIWVPAVVWEYFNVGLFSAVLLALWSGFVYLLLNNIVFTYLISRDSHLPVVLALLGMLGGLMAFGLLGIFLGPTLLAVGATLLQEWRTAAPSARAVPVSRGALAEKQPDQAEW